jgi:16S rRNA (cytidine1402-2'-O)-methyltransferase
VEAQRQHGTLYLVTTPIGNLQDMSERAIATLREADLIVAEDTRRAQKLLSHLNLHKPFESFHGDSSTRKTARLIQQLLEGRDIAYVSDGGTPGVADPGRELVSAAAAVEAPVVAIPGPCALITALSVSGMLGDRFVFAGFPPRKPGERLAFLRRFKAMGLTLVLYEAPHRVVDTLQAVAEVFADRPLLVARELTKRYEELLRGTAAELAAVFAEREPRGEFALVIEGGEEAPAPVGERELEPAVRRLLQAGLGTRDTAGVLADLGLVSRREAYQVALAVKKEEMGQEENTGDDA